MKRHLHLFFITLISIVLSNPLSAQSIKEDNFIKNLTLEYYLPIEDGITYDKSIPTPKEYFGFEIGQQHVPYFQAIAYLQLLADRSDRVISEFYGESYEHRPLQFLTISSPSNLANIEHIQRENKKLTDPDQSGSVDKDNLPIVTFLTYTIHGNEASGINASLVVAYFLAAAEGDYINSILSEMVIILQPCQNPDGYDHYAAWVNSARSFTTVTDDQHREFREPQSPSSRSNHYWFDLNRDWVTVQHPESYYKVQYYHKWTPLVVGDYHEHGTPGLGYFSPGIPTSVNNNIPPDNYEYEYKVAQYHAAEMEKIGFSYYTKEGYDNFYPGKGAAFPDLLGAIAILFEHPNPRGQIIMRNGIPVSLASSSRNQALCSYSLIKAALEMKSELIEYRIRAYKDAATMAKKDPVKGYVFGENPYIDKEFANILFTHNIEVFRLKKDITINNKKFTADNSYFVPAGQREYRLLKTIMEKDREYVDSTFYDVTTWTTPLGFNLNYAEVLNTASLAGERVYEIASFKKEPLQRGRMGYIFEQGDQALYTFLYQLMAEGVKLRCSNAPFEYSVNSGELREFDPGSIVLLLSEQNIDSESIYYMISDFYSANNTAIYAVNSGFGKNLDLGSRQFRTITLPKIALITGAGSSTGTLGELWYLFDNKVKIPVTLIESQNLATADLDRYNLLILCGSYNTIGARAETKIKEWTNRSGNNIIGVTNALPFLSKLDLVKIEQKEAAPARDANRIRGIIVESDNNKESPLCWGIIGEKTYHFKNNNIFLAEKSSDKSTLLYSNTPVISGCTSDVNKEILSSTPAVVKSGRVIYFSNPPFFRGFFYGSAQMLLNTVFFRELM